MHLTVLFMHLHVRMQTDFTRCNVDGSSYQLDGMYYETALTGLVIFTGTTCSKSADLHS